MSAKGSHDAPVPDPISEPSAFFRQSAKLCAGYPVSRLKIIIDGQDVSGDYLLLEAMNTKFIGTNLYLAPEADANDGLLDLVLLPPEDRDRFAAYLSARAQQLQESALLPVHKGKQVRIEFQTRDVHVDDQVYPPDSLSLATPSIAHVSVAGSALEFLVPGPT